MGILVSLAVCISRITTALSRRLGRQGAIISGTAAQIICPKIIAKLSAQVREKVIVVCGTNGKTTTINMIASVMEADGKKVICNRTGANLPNGVASAFVSAATRTGRIDADYAVIEVDEGYARRVLPQLSPDLLILTNLFRDQLDRYGEIDTTIELLAEAIQKTKDVTLLVNGDDVLCAYIAAQMGKPFFTYGIGERVEAGSVNEIREGRFCKLCGAKLIYSFYHFAHLGDYRCPRCGFHRPKPDFDGRNISLADPLSLDICCREERAHFQTHYRGLYTLYNLLAGYGAIRLSGLTGERFQQMLSSFRPANGRMETFRIQGCSVLLNLSKNPAGFNQNIAAVLSDTKPKDIIVAIGDKEQDGRDISWLWDVDFDALRDETVKQIWVAGTRAPDLCLRLKYEDIPSKEADRISSAVEEAVKTGTKNLYVLANYSMLSGVRALLKSLEEGDSHV